MDMVSPWSQGKVREPARSGTDCIRDPWPARGGAATAAVDGGAVMGTAGQAAGLSRSPKIGFPSASLRSCVDRRKCPMSHKSTSFDHDSFLAFRASIQARTASRVANEA